MMFIQVRYMFLFNDISIALHEIIFNISTDKIDVKFA